MTALCRGFVRLASSRGLRAWAVAAWLALMMLLAGASLARADNPIERLQRGDLEGFMDDALRTEWVVAATAGTLSAVLAPALASALSRT
ncbi:MAG: hypothetical protein ACODAJ_10950, partial [Planctomycetota bacterium]